MNAPQQVLVINAGSTSLKLSLIDCADNAVHITAQHATTFPAASLDRHDYTTAAQKLLAVVEPQLAPQCLIAHRVVHGGDSLGRASRINHASLTKMEALATLAPLHQPPALAVIRALQKQRPTAPMFAVFDTGLYRELPEVARYYALPAELAQEYGIRRYGFHGLAHRSLIEQYRAAGGQARRLITLQLGGGCSATAFLDQQVLDTSMGFSPAEGLMMATRCGRLDTSVVLHLLRHGWDASRIEQLINHQAGLLGVSGLSSDMRVLLQSIANGHAKAELAVDHFCQHLCQQIGAFAASLGGLEALVFGGGIGFGSAEIRARVCHQLAWLGLELDQSLNTANSDHDGQLSAAESAVDIRCFDTAEAPVIAREALAFLADEPVESTSHTPNQSLSRRHG